MSQTDSCSTRNMRRLMCRILAHSSVLATNECLVFAWWRLELFTAKGAVYTYSTHTHTHNSLAMQNARHRAMLIEYETPGATFVTTQRSNNIYWRRQIPHTNKGMIERSWTQGFPSKLCMFLIFSLFSHVKYSWFSICQAALPISPMVESQFLLDFIYELHCSPGWSHAHMFQMLLRYSINWSRADDDDNDDDKADNQH